MLRVLDLFSGIGGFSLGLERAGMKTVAFCEIESFPRKILAKHWPEVPIYDDVRTLTAERLTADGIAVDVICGGFPCQDISFAGSGAGMAGERSGLWSQYSRLIDELAPAFVIVENVAALLGRGLGTVLGDLATLGYDAEWHCIPAAAIGAPHRRDRIWVMAYPNAANGGRSVAHADKWTGRSAYYQGKKVQVDLNQAVKLWPTPRANDAEKRGDFDPTNPRNGLPAAVKLLPTPTARDWKSCSTGKQGNSRPLLERVNGALNPTWVEWLMGFPLGWTALEGLVTRSSRKSQK